MRLWGSENIVLWLEGEVYLDILQGPEVPDIITLPTLALFLSSLHRPCPSALNLGFCLDITRPLLHLAVQLASNPAISSLPSLWVFSDGTLVSYSQATKYHCPNYLCIRSYLGFLINVDQLLLILAAVTPKRAEPCTLPRTSENPHGYPESHKGNFQVGPPRLTSICREQAGPQSHIILGTTPK